MLFFKYGLIVSFQCSGLIVRIKGHPNANKYLKLKIPNIAFKSQQKIVDEIKVELDKQGKIKEQIKQERNKIDEIIEKAVY